MNDFFDERLRPLSIGILFSLGSLLFGFGMGGAFGAAEDAIKAHLDSRADAVLQTAVYGGDTLKARQTAAKAWTYLKRAHLHAGGLGAASLAQILLLALLGVPSLMRRIAAGLLGAGALFYSLYWLFAGLKAPSVGGTDQARDALEWLAIPSAGAVMVGTVLTLVFFVRALLRRSS